MTGHVLCGTCGQRAKLVTGDKVYPHRPDLKSKKLWLCDCGAYVGCHPGTDRPLGAPSNAQQRKAKMAAHAEFDPLWKSGWMSRTEAYSWLGSALGTIPANTHIGYFTVEQCERVVELCEALGQSAGASK